MNLDNVLMSGTTARGHNTFSLLSGDSKGPIYLQAAPTET